jgi:hypothetical protein
MPPSLGILDGDEPSARMLVVLWKGRLGMRLAYVNPRIRHTFPSR